MYMKLLPRVEFLMSLFVYLSMCGLMVGMAWYASDLTLNAAGCLFGQYKIIQKTWKMFEILANGYSSESI